MTDHATYEADLARETDTSALMKRIVLRLIGHGPALNDRMGEGPEDIIIDLAKKDAPFKARLERAEPADAEKVRRAVGLDVEAQGPDSVEPKRTQDPA